MDEIKEAKRLFNETWDLIDKPERSDAEKIDMLHKAHTSCWLWRSAGQPKNNAVGEWQVSHVYCLLGFGEPALLHAELSLQICLDHKIEGLTLAFAYEGLARAYSVLKDETRKLENLEKGFAAAETEPDPRERAYVQGELQKLRLS